MRPVRRESCQAKESVADLRRKFSLLGKQDKTNMSRDVTQKNKNYAYHTKNLPKRPNQSIFETDRTTIDETFDQSDLESEDSAHGLEFLKNNF